MQQTWAVETFNVNNKRDTSGRINAQIGLLSYGKYSSHGLRMVGPNNDVEQKKGIYLYQELNASNQYDDMRGTGYDGQSYCLTQGGTNQGGGVITMRQYSWAKKHGTNQFERKNGDTLNAIVWTPQFKLLDVILPKYWETDLDNRNPVTRLGCRSTPWTILQDTETNKIYTVISVHGNSGSNDVKRLELLSNLLTESADFQNPIIGGDFNLVTDVFMNQLSKPDNLKPISRYVTNPNKITHINNGTNFEGRLDWILFGNNIKVSEEHIEDITRRNRASPSDHALVRYIIS